MAHELECDEDEGAGMVAQEGGKGEACAREVRVRLGFWNRLAIVGGILLTLIGPSWLIIADRIEETTRRMEGHSSCIAGVGKPESDLTYDYCRETWLPNDYYQPGWFEWFEAALAFAVLAFIIYALIWIFVWVAKWIWRGRNQGA